MQLWRSHLRLTASAFVLWQIAVLALGPVVLHYCEATVAQAQLDAADCPVCAHQTTPGAKCPMHSAAAAGASNGAACALGSGDSATAKLLTLMGSAGLLIRPVDTGEPLVVARMFASSSIFPSDFSPLPTIPPPRA